MEQPWAVLADDPNGFANSTLDVAAAVPAAVPDPLTCSTSKASASTPHASLSRLAPGVSAEASAAAPAAGSDAVAEQEHIQSERAVALDAFLRDWRLELTPKLVEHS